MDISFGLGGPSLPGNTARAGGRNSRPGGGAGEMQ